MSNNLLSHLFANQPRALALREPNLALHRMRVLLSALLVSLAFGLGGINCEICQDVVGAFRRGWPSLGARSLSSPVSLTLAGKAARGGGGAGVGGSAIAPAPPGCGAFAPGSRLRAACVHMRCARARARARSEWERGRRAARRLPLPARFCLRPLSLPPRSSPQRVFHKKLA